jgi:AcrR family transcriptional regulator
MAKPVKTRAYQSAVRQEQAARTRARVVEAADALFIERGYVRTTIKDIAQDAGVAADTVYAAFGSKPRVLTAVLDARLAPAGEASVLDRGEAQHVRDEPDPRRQLQLFAQDMAAVSRRVRPIYEIMRTASAAEPDLAAVFLQMEGQRLNNMRQVVLWLADHSPLRCEIEDGAQTIWALTSPDVGRMFCDRLNWTDDDYAAWLEDSLVRLLLPDPPPPSPRPARRRSA